MAKTSSSADACPQETIEKAVAALTLPEEISYVGQVASISFGWIELLALLVTLGFYCLTSLLSGEEKEVYDERSVWSRQGKLQTKC